MANGDVYRAVLVGRLFDQYLVNVLHFRARQPDTNALDCATAVRNWRESALAPWQSNQYLYRQVDVYPVIPFGVAPQTALPNVAGGSLNGDAMPPQIAVIWRLKSDQTSRHMNGRVYLPGPYVGILNAQGHLDASDMQSQATAVAATLSLFGPTGTSKYELGVWSRSLAGPAPNFNTAAFTPITHISVPDVLYTQRRRTIGVGV
jgi:hypothetical protein